MPSTAAVSHIKEAMSADSCSIDGNEGLYGLGIRIAIYLQWLVLLVTTAYLHDDVPFFQTVNIIFQIAIFSALVMLTVLHTLAPADPIITFYLLFGALSTIEGNALDPRTRIGLSSLALYLAISCYAIWFWFKGLDVIAAASEDQECITVAFFGDISATGGFRTFSKILSVTVALGFALVFAVSLLLGEKLKNRRDARAELKKARLEKAKADEHILPKGHNSLATHETHNLDTLPNKRKPTGTAQTLVQTKTLTGEEGTSQKKSPEVFTTTNRHDAVDHSSSSSNKTKSKKQKGVKSFRFLLSVVFTAISIASVEYLIAANHVDNVNNARSIGQLLPLLIAVFGLLQAALKALTTDDEEEEDEEGEGEKHSDEHSKKESGKHSKEHVNEHSTAHSVGPSQERGK